MENFDLVVIGACHGFWLENDVKKCSNKVLLIEPVKYNFDQLKNRFKNYRNIIFENIAIGDKNELIDFFHVLESSLPKLKKHWASGIGSFSKEHILKHRTKRFQITEEDINCIKIKAITFNKLIEKYKIEYINKLVIDAEGLDSTTQMSIRALKQKHKIIAITGNEGKRIGGKRKMEPIPVGWDLTKLIILEFIFWNNR